METKDWVEEILKLYREGSSVENAVALILRIIEESKGDKVNGNKRTYTKGSCKCR